MLTRPNGYDYWINEPGNVHIREDAPEWAKEEFNDYMQRMKDLVNGRG